MKSELKAKLLRHLAAKKGDAGFTLIELLVVIIIIGILSAIALPSFLNQANKAKQSEAKTYVGSVNRAQQALYLEETEFAVGNATAGSAENKEAVEELGIGIPLTTTNYAYIFTGDNSGVTIGARQYDDNAGAFATDSALKAYKGGVTIATAANGDATTVAVVCGGEVSQKGGGPDGSDPVNYTELANDNPAAACGANVYEPLKK